MEQKISNELLIEKVLINCSYGLTPKEVCYRIAGGNIIKGIAYLSRFEAIMQKNKEMVFKIMDRLRENQIDFINPFEKAEEKIVRMPIRSRVTEAEINSLFLGLARIIKQQAQDDAKNFVSDQLSSIGKLKLMIEQKNYEIDSLKKQIEIFKKSTHKAKSQKLM